MARRRTLDPVAFAVARVRGENRSTAAKVAGSQGTLESRCEAARSLEKDPLVRRILAANDAYERIFAGSVRAVALAACEKLLRQIERDEVPAATLTKILSAFPPRALAQPERVEVVVMASEPVPEERRKEWAQALLRRLALPAKGSEDAE